VTINFPELAEALQKLEEEIGSDSIEEEMSAKEKKFAALAPPEDEITYADKIAGATGKSEEGDSDDDKDDDKVDEELDLSALVAAVMENFDLDESEEELEEDIEINDSITEDEEELEEEIDADSLIDAVMEKLTVDMGADLAGWAGRRAEDKMYEMEKELAARRSTSLEQDSTLGRGMADRTDTDPQKELEDLKQAQEELVFENNQLKEKLQDYANVVEQLKESVTDVNLSNARLLYTNRVLRNTSLNERQKNKIAEAISKAGSVPEAKTIFETLQSTVESTPKRGPQSLSETINRRSSILRASSRKETTKVDPLADRMKKLAGIN
ncbi:MAG: hypothetical protein VXZ51_03295, partial [Actinomycetota bacterium]|nr:hypothetical protein [Actinomycetota bacterium]